MNLLERAATIGIEGFMHCDELEKLVDLACGKAVLEVGSFKGLSAWAMASVAKGVTCIDTWKSNSAGQFQLEEFTTLDDFERAIWRFNNIVKLIGTSEHWGNKVDSAYDMIFLDAMHTHEDVRGDIQRWWPKLNPGGTFVWHDYGHDHFPGVKKAVDEFLAGKPLVGQVGTLAWVTKT